MSISLQRYPVFDVATPLRDLVFYEVVDYNLKANRSAEYGRPHHNTNNYPNHSLVYITPHDKEGSLYRFYYAANRSNQDDYNWTLNSGEQLVRTYLILRSLYYERSVQEAAAASPVINGEFTFPLAGTPDVRFPSYGFADDTVAAAPEELAGLYIVVQRRFIEPVTVDIKWSTEFDSYIKVTKEIIPAEVNPSVPINVAGKTIEITQGNRFHDIQITTELIDDSGNAMAFPFEKDVIPGYEEANFPAKLESIIVRWAWAYADSATAAHSYSEDYYFDFKITKPRQGPYPATIRRFVTDDPESIQAAHPLGIKPSTVIESIGIVYSWWNAGTEGNSTAAVAKAQEIPDTIHDYIEVQVSDPDPSGAVELNGVALENRTLRRTLSLPKTPNYDEFVGASKFIVKHNLQKLPFDLYEVSVVEIDITDLYGTP